MTDVAKKWFATALVAFALASTQDRLGAQASVLVCSNTIAGRYVLTLSEWSRPLGANSAYHAVPTDVLLDTVAAKGGWRVSPDIQYPHPHHFPAPRWALLRDTVQIVWSNGFQPTILRLVRTNANELRGEAIVGSDANEFGDNPPRAQVTAKRIACAAKS